MDYREFPSKSKLLTANEVFGVQRNLPMNYVERPEVDGRLADALQHKQHIVIYGSSKQGKTSLRKWAFGEQPHMVVSCINVESTAQIHLAILKEAGYEIQSVTSTSSEAARVKLSFGFEWPGGIKPGIEAEDVLTLQKQVAVRHLDLDPSDINDVIKALKASEFSGLIEGYSAGSVEM